MPSTSKRRRVAAPTQPKAAAKPKATAKPKAKRRERGGGGGGSTDWIAEESHANVVLGVVPHGFHRLEQR